MGTLHIEHPIQDFAAWKMAFDRDPAGREASQVRAYRIMRPVDDERYVIIDLDFDTTSAAESFLAKMREVWRSAAATSVLFGAPKTRIVEVVEQVSY